jgi:hypothetical protein
MNLLDCLNDAAGQVLTGGSIKRLPLSYIKGRGEEW